MLDVFGKPVDLSGKTLWLLDMDGTIYMEDRIFDGTLDLLARIRAQGGRYVFITNNSSKSVADYLTKVRRMGIPASEEDFFTSAQAAVLLLREQYPGAKVYCQGTQSLIRQLREGGIDVTEAVEPVDVVLLGFDLELTSEKLRRTCEILTLQNPVYLATNPQISQLHRQAGAHHDPDRHGEVRLHPGPDRGGGGSGLYRHRLRVQRGGGYRGRPLRRGHRGGLPAYADAAHLSSAGREADPSVPDRAIK